jgi:ribose transport system substrate-binding protein
MPTRPEKIGKVVAAFFVAALAGASIPGLACRREPSPGGGETGAAAAIRAGNVVILDTRTDLTDRARAKQNVEDVLIRYPDIDCLVGLWAYNGPAILSAVKDAGKEGKVPIVAFDEEESTLQGIADGYIGATVVQQPYYFGYHSVRILAALARGDKSVLPAGGIHDVPVQVITRDGVREFWDRLKKLVAGQEVAGDTPPAPPPAGEKVRVAFVTNNPSDFWRIALAGIRRAEKEFNAECTFLTPPEGTAADQQRMVEDLMTKGVSGMAISPNDAENQVDLLDRAAAVMNVICHDSDCPKSKRLCYVGTNNYRAGREAGKLIQKTLPKGGELVLFVGRLDAQNAIERRQGIIDELSGAPPRN